MSLSIASEIVVLAVIWNEIQGPEICDIAPEDELLDPVNIALQIYLSSVAVFGQHGQTKQVDFSLPLLSISPDHVVYVAFDSWPDAEVRGDERPFFLGFIMNKETYHLIAEDLSNSIWSYMETFKEQKMEYQVHNAFEKTMEQLKNRKRASEETVTPIIIEQAEPNYTTIDAIKDVDYASDLWVRKKDRGILKTVLKAANKLESAEEYGHAGRGFFLAGTVYFQNAEYEQASIFFNKAVDDFENIQDHANAAEARYNLGVTAFRKQDYNLAKKSLALCTQSEAPDAGRKARMYLQQAQVFLKVGDFDQSIIAFEKAVEHADKNNEPKFAATILNQFAFRISEKIQEVDDTKKEELYKLMAKQRIGASEYLEKAGELVEAGKSAVLASKIFTQLKNMDSAVNYSLKAKDYFILGKDFGYAARIILDLLELNQLSLESTKIMSNEALDLLERIDDIVIKQSLHGRILTVLGDNAQSAGDFWSARKYFEDALEELRLTSTQTTYIRAALKLANYLFNVFEDYHHAGEIFEEISTKLPEDSDQAPKLQRNAHVSYRRGVSLYISAGTFMLQQMEGKSSVDAYLKALELMNKTLKTSSGSEKDNEALMSWLKQQQDSIKHKLPLFSSEQQRVIVQKLDEINSK